MTAATVEVRPNPGAASLETPAFRGHIAELDALRAFGLTMVLLSHMWPRESQPVWSLLQTSWTLMDAFFVLSGFLITGILLDSRAQTDYYRSYYVRRALRILPLYYAVITVLACGTLFVSGFAGIMRYWGSPLLYFVYLGNIPEGLSGEWMYAAWGSYIPLWSLQVEEQFYLLFPLLVHRLRLETLGRILLGLACLSTILRIGIYWLEPSNTLAQYVLLPCRMEGLALGAWIAVRFRLKPWSISKKRLTILTAGWLAATYLLAASNGYDHTTPFNRTFGLLISPIAWAHAVLWLIVFRGSALTACLRLRPVQHLGKISYAGYVFHWPVAAIIVSASTALGIESLGRGYAKPFAVFGATVLLASLSWHFFESPLLRRKDRLARRASSTVPGNVTPGMTRMVRPSGCSHL